MKIKANISVLFHQDRDSVIEIRCSDSNQVICEVNLNPEQLVAVLSRQVRIPCDADVTDHPERIGKTLEVTKHEFLAEDIKYHDKDQAYELGLKSCPDGWELQGYFQSQDSFFQKDGKQWAQGIIRRWVDKAEAS